MNKFKNIKFSYFLLSVFSFFSFDFLKTTTEIEINTSNSEYKRTELTDSEILEQKELLEKNLPKSINHTYLIDQEFSNQVKLFSRSMDINQASNIIYEQNTNSNKLYDIYYNYCLENNYISNNKKIIKSEPIKIKYIKPLMIKKNETNVDSLIFIEKEKTNSIANLYEAQDVITKKYLENEKIDSNYNGILSFSNNLKESKFELEQDEDNKISEFIKNFSKEENNKIFNSKKTELNDIFKEIDDQYTIYLHTREKKNRIFIDLKPFLRNMKLTKKEENDKRNLEDFFNKYKSNNDESRMTISEYLSEYLDKNDLQVKVKLNDLLKHINYDVRLSDHEKKLNIELLKEFFLNKQNEGNIPNLERNKIEALIKDEIKNISFSDKLESIRKSIFDNGNFIYSINKIETIEKFNLLIEKIYSFYNDKAFLSIINCDKTKNHFLNHINFFKKIIINKGFKLDAKEKEEFKDIQFNSALKKNNNKNYEQKYASLFLCKDYNNLIFNALKISIADMANTIFGTYFIKNKKLLCNVEYIKNNNNEKGHNIQFENLIDLSVDKYIENSLEINNKNSIIVGANGTGKTSALKALIQSLLLAKTLGVAAAKNIKITGKSYFMHFFKRPSSDENKDLSNFQAERDYIKNILYFIKQNKNIKVLIVADELFSSTSKGIVKGAVREEVSEVANLINDHDNNVIITTHQDVFIEEIKKICKTAETFAIKICLLDKEDNHKEIINKESFVYSESFELNKFNLEKSDKESTIYLKSENNKVSIVKKEESNIQLNLIKDIADEIKYVDNGGKIKFRKKILQEITNGFVLIADIVKIDDNESFYLKAENIKLYDSSRLNLKISKGFIEKIKANEQSLNFIDNIPFIEKLLVQKTFQVDSVAEMNKIKGRRPAFVGTNIEDVLEQLEEKKNIIEY